MSTAVTVPQAGRLRAWWDAILVYRQPRMAASLALGFSCGLPFILVGQTLSAWLRQSGIERATIGMLSWVALLYTVKFLWAPVVDRLRLPLLHDLLGRRRSWMFLAQCGIALAVANLARQDPAANLAAVVAGAILIAFCSATQDIAVDAWRVESAPPDEQGAMAAGYQLGYRIAVMTGTAGSFWIAADYGWHVGYLVMALLAGIGIAATILATEPEATTREGGYSEARVVDWLAARPHWPAWLRTLGSTFIGAVVCPLTDFFTRYGLALGALLFAFIGCYRLTDYAMGPMANPFYIDHGYTLKEVAAVVKGVGLFAALAGVIVGGILVARLGVMRALVAGSLMMMVSNLGFSALATTGGADLLLLGVVNSFDNLAYNVHGTALLAFLASLTNTRYTATQYAVLSSIYALPGKLLMGFSGIVAEHLGYPGFFIYTALLSLPGLLLLYFVARRHPVPASGVAT